MTEKIVMEKRPPEGGWGYFIIIGFSVMIVCSAISPLMATGLVYEKFLSTLGDTTSLVSLISAVMISVHSFSGLCSGKMLQIMSYRKVALIGATIFFIGNVCSLEVYSIFQVIFTYGILQGVGLGLMAPAFFTAFNSYFREKKLIAMGIAQSTICTITMFLPQLIAFLLKDFGHFGVLLLLTGIYLNNFPASLLLQPVEWHMVCKKSIEMTPLKEEDKEIGSKLKAGVDNHSDPLEEDQEISLGFWQSLLQKLNLHYFKEPKFMFLSVGLALSFTADISFIPIIPQLMTDLNFTIEESATFMSIYATADLVGRFALTGISFVTKLNHKAWFTGAVFISIIFRTAFIMYDTFWWRAVTLMLLGPCRSTIQTLIVLVVSDEYAEDFAVAFSVYNFISGIFFLIMPFLVGIVKHTTGSNTMVIHLFSVFYATCLILWGIEYLLRKRRRISKSKILGET